MYGVVCVVCVCGVWFSMMYRSMCVVWCVWSGVCGVVCVEWCVWSGVEWSDVCVCVLYDVL